MVTPKHSHFQTREVEIRDIKVASALMKLGENYHTTSLQNYCKGQKKSVLSIQKLIVEVNENVLHFSLSVENQDD